MFNSLIALYKEHQINEAKTMVKVAAIEILKDWCLAKFGYTDSFTCCEIYRKCRNTPKVLTSIVLSAYRVAFVHHMNAKHNINVRENDSFFISTMANLNVDSYTSLRMQWLQFIIDTITEELKHEPIYWDTTGDSPSLL